MERIDNLYDIIDRVRAGDPCSFNFKPSNQDTVLIFSNKESYLVNTRKVRMAMILCDFIKLGYEDIELLDKIHDNIFGDQFGRGNNED